MISVLGIVSSVVVFSVGGINDRGQNAACSTDVRVMSTAEEANKAEFGGYGLETDLVAHNLLDKISDLHDIQLNYPAGAGAGAVATSYTILNVGVCAPAVATTLGGATTTTAVATTTTLGASSAGGGPAGISLKLVDTANNGLPGGSPAYMLATQGYWVGMAVTAANGLSTANSPAGTYSLRVDYRGQNNSFGPTAMNSGDIATFGVADVTVRLTGATGALASASIAHLGNDGYWVGDGNTDSTGALTLKVLPGSYSFRADFLGQTNTMTNIVVAGNRNVDFPLASATVRLTGGSGGLAAASIAHLGNDGYWVGDGNTSSSATATFYLFPASNYSVRADYLGQTSTQSAITIVAPTTTVDFVLTTVSVNLTGSGGSIGSASIAHLGNDGYWVGDPATNSSGVSTFFLLGGTGYSFRADFLGQSNSQSNVTIAGATSAVNFALTTVLVRLTGVVGTQPAAAVAHLGNDGYWVGDGNTDANGVVSIVMLPSSTYQFRADFRGQTAALTGVVVTSATSTVDFALTNLAISVTDKGTPIAGSAVSMTANDGYAVSAGTTDAKGIVNVLVLAGTYNVSTVFSSNTKSQSVTMPGGSATLAF